MNDTTHLGRLLLVPTPLDFGCAAELIGDIGDALPAFTIVTSARTTHWISENAKSTRAFLNRVHIHTPLTCSIQDMHIHVLPREAHKSGDHTVGAMDSQAKEWLAPALQGFDVGLVSEAGTHIKALEATALKTGQTQLCIETPYRNLQLLQTLINTLSPNTRLAVACGLAVAPDVRSQTVAVWREQAKHNKLPKLDLPAVFLWGA